MRRLFWLAMGAGVTGVAVRRANKVARSLTPAGLTDQVGGLADMVRDFADDVRAGMTERELELRDALGLDGDQPRPELTTGDSGTTAERKGDY